MRATTRDEHAQAIELFNQHANEPNLYGRHAPNIAANPVTSSVGSLRARADLRPWQSSDAGRHRADRVGGELA